MRKIFMLLSILVLAACGGKKGVTVVTPKFQLESLKYSDAEKIKNTYPDANILEDENTGMDSDEVQAYTTLFPNTEDELLITWKSTERKEIEQVRYSGNGRWTSKTGVAIGMTYDELNTLNNNEISFYGFGWDYSGAVDFNGGKLEQTNTRVFLRPEGEIPSKFYGDKIVKATKQEIDDLNLKIASIIVNFDM